MGRRVELTDYEQVDRTVSEPCIKRGPTVFGCLPPEDRYLRPNLVRAGRDLICGPRHRLPNLSGRLALLRTTQSDTQQKPETSERNSGCSNAADPKPERPQAGVDA